MNGPRTFCAVAGNIGSGKSTLTGLLAERFAWRPYYEHVEGNPYLSDFYADMERWSFHLQIYFLSKRFQHHQEILAAPESVIQDRTIYEDAAIFARNLYAEGVMDERDYGSYLRMYEAISAALRPPDMLVYLRASLPTLRTRIALRGRAYETAISDDYLARLNLLYESWIAAFDLCEIVVVETDDLDFVHDRRDLERILDTLETVGLAAPVVG